jgi:hypothetical protein
MGAILRPFRSAGRSLTERPEDSLVGNRDHGAVQEHAQLRAAGENAPQHLQGLGVIDLH